ncbi:MAG: hypothetical protein B7Z31_10405 [Rhodobacterales bacterium 12-65-15]|nr:MAG: hypothetical protein B7Z31_10405 [Rhodobacterales bacterium 12-65-15]
MLCTTAKDQDSLPLPHDLTFFVPDGIRLGDYGIPKVATDADYPLGNGERLVLAANAEVGTVAAVCRTEPYSDGRVRCQIRHAVSDGISVYWEIYTQPASVNDALLQAEAFARDVCSGVLDLPECAAGPVTPP